MDVHGRTDLHRRNPLLENLLEELGRDLEPAAEAVAARGGEPRHPTLFVVGCPRSGTTLVYQWLASLGVFAYPGNLTARFPTAPWIGARVEQLLTDPAYDHQGELAVAEASADPFRSRLGKTRGPNAPHEFWYFWRRHLPERATHALDAADLATVDAPRLLAELAAWEAVRYRPLLMKGLILNWNLDWLAQTLPHAVFLHVLRDPVANMASLLDARRDFWGRDDRWYSFRPPCYPEYADADPHRQVAAQVADTERGVRAGLAAVDPARSIAVGYEEFCASPATLYEAVRELLARNGEPVDMAYDGPPSFTPSSRDVTGDLATSLRRAYDDIAATSI